MCSPTDYIWNFPEIIAFYIHQTGRWEMAKLYFFNYKVKCLFIVTAHFYFIIFACLYCLPTYLFFHLFNIDLQEYLIC